jgi:GAF domain-containing protein
LTVHDRADTHRADQALDQLGRLSFAEYTTRSVLQKIADLTKDVMPGSIEASVSVLTHDRPSTAVYTGQLALDCDESQYGRGYGPCLHAASTGEVTEVADARVETRWPDYARSAAERGSLSSLSVPLPVSQHVSVALNIYAREPHAFDEDSRSAAARFAPYAAVAIANMHEYESAKDLAGNLQVALQTRAVIDQAKGILMERHKVTADQAFQLLTYASMNSNRKLRDIADHLVETGEFPRST